MEAVELDQNGTVGCIFNTRQTLTSLVTRTSSTGTQIETTVSTLTALTTSFQGPKLQAQATGTAPFDPAARGGTTASTPVTAIVGAAAVATTTTAATANGPAGPGGTTTGTIGGPDTQTTPIQPTSTTLIDSNQMNTGITPTPIAAGPIGTTTAGATLAAEEGAPGNTNTIGTATTMTVSDCMVPCMTTTTSVKA
ncbi:uncharacterized protein ColSpa_08689 [Colletotrichum spaethianum]|uniref:Uncharacterized protein n=1 Tax=Colletotrichum spaethianum TaxID=700344 RepID=A0AA37PA78_9PEZI|nr:uncharacterized protein ColSpa_08689 [Colletotrichum spaethianum]GKT48508.1 hypothetical protein ColSpa_08689 [Colletotrichum spaethianum]